MSNNHWNFAFQRGKGFKGIDINETIYSLKTALDLKNWKI